MERCQTCWDMEDRGDTRPYKEGPGWGDRVGHNRAGVDRKRDLSRCCSLLATDYPRPVVKATDPPRPFEAKACIRGQLDKRYHLVNAIFRPI